MQDAYEEVDVSNATIRLGEADYQAIGVAVTSLSALETTLGIVNLVAEIGAGVPLGEEKYSARFQAMAKKSFRKRAELATENVFRKTGSLEAKEKVERNLKNIVLWRDFICHGVFMKLPDGRLHCRFWDRKSFDEGGGGHLGHTFTPKMLYDLAISATELAGWLHDEFDVDLTNSSMGHI